MVAKNNGRVADYASQVARGREAGASCHIEGVSLHTPTTQTATASLLIRTMSLFRRLWAKIRNPTQCVGRDLEGNRYFEYPSPHGDFCRTKRVVKYRRGYDMWTYIAGEKRLPVQWTTWLTHTRVHPPSMEELYADLERQRRIRINVALIAARDREARNAHRIAAAHQDMPIKDPNAPSFHAEMVPEPSQTAELQAMHATGPTGSPIQQQEQTPPRVNDEPQPWTPRTLQRGS